MKTRILTLIMSLFITTMAFAYDARVDGICYDLDHENKTATVTFDDFDYRYNDYAGYSKSEIIIPERVTYNGEGYSVVSIGALAFYKCSSIASIAIPSSVTSIGYYAFYGCTSLPSITIPNSVTSIGGSAFEGCSSLTSITIGNSVTSIGGRAFYGCSSLTSITIPNSVTEIGDFAFYGCKGLISIDVNESNGNYASFGGVLYDKELTTLIYCPESKTSVEVPNSVTSIVNTAFKGCTFLTSIQWNAKKCDDFSDSNAPFSSIVGQITSFIFGDNVEHIPSYLCYDMNKLTSIEIPNSVTEIGECAFCGCSALTSITIGNSVTEIGVSAFASCSSLSSITIGNSVTEIGNNVFDGCSSLTSITIPNSVTSIGDCAFWSCSSLTSIEIPNSVTSIGKRVFQECSSLTSVIIGNGVTSIGRGAFAYCSLSSVLWNATNCEDFSHSHSEDVYPYIFQGTKISSLIFGDSVKHIPAYICRSSRVISVVMPSSVTSIGQNAFDGCSSLTSITIPNGVTSIGEWAFYDCSSLSEIRLSINDLEEYINSGINEFFCDKISYSATRTLYKDSIELTNIVIPNTVTRIPSLTFYNCSFSSIEIPNSVTEIGNRAFEGCSLTSIEIPNSVTEIGVRAFNGCSNLTSVVWNAVSCRVSSGTSLFYGSGIKTIIFGDSVECIPSYLCYECVELTSIVISNNVISIEAQAFNGCSSLGSVSIGNGVTKIGQGVFYKCSSLTSIKIPNSVTSIGTWVFAYCEKLRNVEIGSSVETIGDCAFMGCSGIYSLKIGAMIPPIVEVETFADVSRTAQIKVPCGAMSAYQASSYWNEFTNYMESPNTLSVEVNDNTMGMAVVTKQNTCTDITAIVQAQARPGYEFVKWSDGFTENPHTVFVMEDMAITAEFAPMTKEYNVSVVCDATMGIVTGGGTYKDGESIIIEAIANDGYHFVKWSDGNTENPRTIVVTEDVELMAEFAKNQYEVNVMAGENGYVTGSGTYDYGTEVTIEALANEGYHFVKWSDGNTENPRTIVVTEDVELRAEFEEDGKTLVDNVDESSVMIYVQNGVFYVEGIDADYNVFDASGRLIYTGRDAQLSLPRGVYVIAIGGEVEKIVL